MLSKILLAIIEINTIGDPDTRLSMTTSDNIIDDDVGNTNNIKTLDRQYI